MERREIVPRAGNSPGAALQPRVSRRVEKALAEVRGGAIIRQAQIQAESLLAASKLHEVDYVALEAMTGQAMLHRWASTLASDDLILADDLRLFRDVVKIGKGEVIADQIDKYRRI